MPVETVARQAETILEPFPDLWIAFHRFLPKEYQSHPVPASQEVGEQLQWVQPSQILQQHHHGSQGQKIVVHDPNGEENESTPGTRASSVGASH